MHRLPPRQLVHQSSNFKYVWDGMLRLSAAHSIQQLYAARVLQRPHAMAAMSMQIISRLAPLPGIMRTRQSGKYKILGDD